MLGAYQQLLMSQLPAIMYFQSILPRNSIDRQSSAYLGSAGSPPAACMFRSSLQCRGSQAQPLSSRCAAAAAAADAAAALPHAAKLICILMMSIVACIFNWCSDLAHDH